jgi:polyamine oxidase
MRLLRIHTFLSVAAAAFQAAAEAPTASACRKTKVLIMGAGMAGITAAQVLANSSISDFVIVEYNSDIGGRISHTTFGKDPTGASYVIELGANWVQGIQSPSGPTNPIWTLALKYNISNTYSNYSSILTYNASGALDYTSLINDYFTAYSTVEQDAGYLLAENLQDRSMRAAFLVAGWNPKKDMNAQAVEWWNFDFEYGALPEQSSEEFAVIVSVVNRLNLVLLTRGFRTTTRHFISLATQTTSSSISVASILSSKVKPPPSLSQTILVYSLTLSFLGLITPARMSRLSWRMVVVSRQIMAFVHSHWASYSNAP